LIGVSCNGGSVASAPPEVKSASTTTTVYGHIWDPCGTFDLTEVTMTIADDDEYDDTTTVESSGYFEFSDVPEGTYYVAPQTMGDGPCQTEWNSPGRYVEVIGFPIEVMWMVKTHVDEGAGEYGGTFSGHIYYDPVVPKVAKDATVVRLFYYNTPAIGWYQEFYPDASGEYLIPCYNTSCYDIEVICPGYDATPVGWSAPLHNDSSITGINFYVD
jgi:hypothetical protein